MLDGLDRVKVDMVDQMISVDSPQVPTEIPTGTIIRGGPYALLPTEKPGIVSWSGATIGNEWDYDLQ